LWVNHPRPRSLPDTEQAAPGLFLEEVFLQLRELLARPDQEPRYTRTVLLAAGWAELEVLVAWLRLTGFQDVFSTYFHSLGVVAGCEGGVGPAYSRLTGWPAAAAAGLGLQEEALALHAVAMDRLQARGRGCAIQQLLDTDCLATERAFHGRLPCPVPSAVCALAVHWVEVAGGGAQLSQLGAALLPLSAGDIDQQGEPQVGFS
jgi:hypothetical protein